MTHKKLASAVRRVTGALCLTALAAMGCEADGGGEPCEDHCTNGIQDCGEEGVDCGGECAACTDPCAGHCGNGVQDCGEEDVDCGGECAACTDPCDGHCSNEIMDCGEEGVDCGGACRACDDPCAGHCENETMDCGEEDVDCGGECAPCGPPPTILRGVNLAGADFGYDNLPGIYGTHYIYPTAEEVDYFTSKGMNVFRLPFRWERMQRGLMGELDALELERMDAFVDYATGRGAWVILDPHNYARYFDDLVGEAVSVEAYADFWTRMAVHFLDNDLVIFGLMNEPHDMTTEMWRDDANAAIAAIRAAGATHMILVPGNGWTGAWTWLESYYGTPNAEVMLTIDDPLDNLAFEVHQYLDEDGSGTSSECVSSTIGAERLTAFTGWLEEHGFRAFLGEFGAAANSTCMEAVDGMLDFMDARPDLWMGWTWWAAGPWWEDYMFSIEPDGGEDKPQMAVLQEHL